MQPAVSVRPFYGPVDGDSYSSQSVRLRRIPNLMPWLRAHWFGGCILGAMRCWWLALGIPVMLGCGEDSSGGAAGNTNVGGSSSGGSGASSGSGGSGGVAGSAGVGAGGTSATGGNAGVAGSSGTAGSAGIGGAGGAPSSKPPAGRSR